MAAPRITQDSVFKAADQLSEQGEYPSVSTVREYLGSGSFSTITKYLQQWREHQDKAAVTIDLPEKVEAAYRKAAVVAWQEASRLANEKAVVAEERMEQERQKHVQASDEASAEIERLETLVQQMELKDQQRQKELEELSQRERSQTERAVRAEAQVNSAAKEANNLNSKVEALEKENKELHNQVGHLEAKLEKEG